MKNRFVSCFLFLSSLGLAGVDADPAFQPHFEAGSVFLAGTAYELVLRDGTYNNPVSQLTWPTPPSLGLEFSVTLPWTAWTSTSVGLQGTFPLGAGTMVDEDWNAQESLSTTVLVYGRSTQQDYLTSHYSAWVEQGFHWGDFTVSAGGLYRWETWEGWNGTGTYQYFDSSSQSHSVDTITFSGPIITYRQQWLIPYVGIEWTWKGAGWSLKPSGKFGPYTWCFDSDLHDYAEGSLLYPTTYQDSTYGGFFGQLGVEAEFPGGAGWTWGFRGSGEMTYNVIGDTTTITTAASSSGELSSYPTTQNGAGTWYYEVAVTAFVRN